jgi:hypothetical protein
MSIINEIATHADGTPCELATTTGNCPLDHRYTAAAAPTAGVKGLLITPLAQIAVSAYADLDAYQQAVGGWITTVQLDERHDMIVNDEGLALQLPLNLLATAIAFQHNQQSPLLGNAIIVCVDHAKGEFVDVDEEFVASVRAIIE